MKSKEQKQKDLKALTEELNDSKTALVLSFTNLTVDKDQEFRKNVREAGAKYQVVKNTIARLAVEGTPFEDAKDHFTGVSAIAWTSDEPVNLSKAVSDFIKDNAALFSFKTGVVEGKVVDFDQIKSIASLPSKEELIGKLLYLLNAPAQRLATVLNAVPRNLAVVMKQISEGEGNVQPKQEAQEEPKTETAEEPKQEETANENSAEVKEETPAAETSSEEKAKTETSNEETKAETVENTEAETSSEEPKAEAEQEEKSE